MSCLKKFHGLYSGQLKDTMGGRLVMSCLSDICLGPSFVQFTPAGAGGQVDGEEGEAEHSGKCSVMQAGGGINR